MPRFNRLRQSRARPRGGQGPVGTPTPIGGGLLGFVPAASTAPSTMALKVNKVNAPTSPVSTGTLPLTDTGSLTHIATFDYAGQTMNFDVGMSADGLYGIRLNITNGGARATGSVFPNNTTPVINNGYNFTPTGADTAAMTGQRLTLAYAFNGDVVLAKESDGTVFIRYAATQQFISDATRANFGTYIRYSGGTLNNLVVGPVATPLLLGNYELDAGGRPTTLLSYAQSDTSVPVYEARLLNSADSTVAIDWQDMLVVDNPIKGAATATLPTQLTAAQRQRTYKVQHRRKGTTDTPVEVVWKPAPSLLMGLNRGGFNGFTNYNRTYSDSDMGPMSVIFCDNRDAIRPPFVSDANLAGAVSGRVLGMDNTGRIFNYRPGESAVRFNLPTQFDAGTWTINLPAGMSAAMTVSNGISISGYTLTSSGPQIGVPEMRVTGTIPPEGFLLSITKTGLTGTVSQQALVEHNQWKVKWYRYMDASRVNNTYETYTSIADEWDGYLGQGPVSARRMAAESLAFNTSPWINNDRGFSADIITHRANVIFTALMSTNLHCAWEVDNEIWNDAFGKAGIYAFEGMKKGYRQGTNGVIGTQVAAMPGLQNRTGDFLGGGTPKVNFAQGDIVYTQNVVPTNQFRGIWQANRAITANNSADALGSVTNAAWTVLATGGDAMVAKALAYSDELERHFSLIKAEAIRIGFPLERVHFVLNSQAIQGFNQSTKNTLLWNDLGKKYGNLVDARAPYFGTELASTTINAPGWTATERALINTDVPAFKTAYYAYVRYLAKKIVDDMAAFSRELDVWCGANNIPLLEHWAYEAGQHFIGLDSPEGRALIYNGTTTNNQLYNIYFNDMYRSQIFGDIYAEYMAYYGVKVGGVLCMFQQGNFKTTGVPATNWLMSDSAFELLPVGQAVAQFAAP